MKNKTIVIWSAFAIAMCALFPVAQASLDGTGSGLVGWWKFDEGTGTSTTADSSGNNNTGTLMKNPAWTTGVSGYALSFNGSNQYVKMSNDPVDINTVTVCAWVYLNADVPSGSLETIVGNGRFFLWAAANNDISLTSNSSNGSTLGSNDSLKSGQWQHVCGIRNSDGTGAIYINGAASASGNVGAPVSMGAVGIGSDQYGEYFWNGYIDDVRIYNRALAGPEISSLYTGIPVTPDTQAPTKPTGLTATANSQTQITLSWSASTDDVAVTGYSIYRNGTKIKTTTSTTYSDTSLIPSTTYSYTVSAFDAWLNMSDPSSSASATTNGPHGSAPSVPTGLQASAIYATQLTLTWTASTGPFPVAGYDIYRNGLFVGTSTTNSYFDSTGLTASTPYSYTVSSYDDVPNTSNQSNPLNVSTNNIQPLIPFERRITWTGNAGVPGGIAAIDAKRTNIINVTNFTDSNGTAYHADNTGATDASAVINIAIRAASNTNSVVYLPAGTYAINNLILIPVGASNFTIRGAGANSTILNINTGGGIMTQDGGIGPGNAIISGSSKGSNAITVSSVGTLTAGTMILITEDNDPNLMWSDSNGSNLLHQLVMVTAVDPAHNTITFDPPLVYSFSSNPAYMAFNVPPSSFIGLEDMTIDGANSAGYGGGLYLVNLSDTYASWIKGVEAKNIPESAFFFINALRDEIRDNFIHTYDASSTNESHGILMYGTTSSFLVENNIATDVWNLAGTNDTLGSVMDYNYCFENHTGPNQGDFATLYQVSCFNMHFGHGMMTLFEGNVGDQWQNDGYHGSVSHITLFRNWFNGLSYSTDTQNRVMVDIDQHGYYHNVAGNVLGDKSWELPSDQYEMTTLSWSVGGVLPAIYRLGYPNMGNDGYAVAPPYVWYDDVTQVTASLPTYPGQWMPTWLDNTPVSSGGFNFQGVKPTLLRTANFDYLHNCAWDDTNGKCLTSAQVSALALPASLYYTSKPAWWPNKIPWPPIGPDVTGGNAGGTAGNPDTNVYKIPAQVCFETYNLAIGSNGLSGGSFNAADCYPGDYGNTGDVSGDGTISAYDAALALRSDLTADQQARAEVSGRGGVTNLDAALISQRAVGLIAKFPVEG